MGCSHLPICSQSLRCLVISLLFLLVSGSTLLKFMVEGRAVRAHSKLVEESTKMGSEEKAVMRALIGSRPPRCERMCSWCGHCEAVQVPAVPKDKKGSIRYSSTTALTISISRGEDTNYKPISWKCKCGDMIFNP